ncbi:MAG: DUF3054 domain-containing protein [Ardenticatenaceae bacterium]|nr:DUF3054 domain-containing protein [Ardenticatenaceae bacterium]HBY98901.1 DUF3054 domain-containing protein [Chloroflexota bacterium]
MDRAQPSRHTTHRQASLVYTALLVIGDVIAFVVFAWIGRRSHAEAAGLDAIAQTLGTAVPFIAAWFLISPVTGTFGTELGPARMAGRTALGWLLVWPAALLLRALALQRGVPLIFALITGVTNLVLLVGWRSVFAWLWRR